MRVANLEANDLGLRPPCSWRAQGAWGGAAQGLP